MTWQSQHVHLTLRSDLHCGHLPLGFVARTYPFVPCHLPFFAMIPAAVALLGMPDVRASYKKVLQLFESCLRSTPFYICEDVPLFPWDKECQQRVERHYLSSQHGVTLDWKSRSAEEGKLFETEIILQYAKKRQNPTLLEGYIFFRPHNLEDVEFLPDATMRYGKNTCSLEDILAHVRLGGNTTRSLAKPCHVKLLGQKESCWDVYPVILNKDYPQLMIEAEKAGPVPMQWFDTTAIRGKASVLTGRIYGKNGSGLEMDTTHMAWREGWKNLEPCTMSLTYPRMGTVV